MSQNDLNIANASGAAVRADLNNALQALASISAGSSAPGTTYAYQVWLDTSASTTEPVIKQRNQANNAWITIAKISTAGNLILEGTGAIDIPVGTTAQRPTANQGMFRYNTTTSSFEGYDGSAWGAIGGGGGATGASGEAVFWENEATVNNSYTITSNFNAGVFGPLTVASGCVITVNSGSTLTIV